MQELRQKIREEIERQFEEKREEEEAAGNGLDDTGKHSEVSA